MKYPSTQTPSSLHHPDTRWTTSTGRPSTWVPRAEICSVSIHLLIFLDLPIYGWTSSLQTPPIVVCESKRGITNLQMLLLDRYSFSLLSEFRLIWSSRVRTTVQSWWSRGGRLPQVVTRPDHTTRYTKIVEGSRSLVGPGSWWFTLDGSSQRKSSD